MVRRVFGIFVLAFVLFVQVTADRPPPNWIQVSSTDGTLEWVPTPEKGYRWVKSPIDDNGNFKWDRLSTAATGSGEQNQVPTGKVAKIQIPKSFIKIPGEKGYQWIPAPVDGHEWVKVPTGKFGYLWALASTTSAQPVGRQLETESPELPIAEPENEENEENDENVTTEPEETTDGVTEDIWARAPSIPGQDPFSTFDVEALKPKPPPSSWGQLPSIQWKPGSQYPLLTPGQKPSGSSSSTGGNTKSIGCGMQAPAFQPLTSQLNRIVNGNEAKQHSWPWLVIFRQGHGAGVACGGSLLRVKDDVDSSDIVLTAAHCLVDRNDQPLSGNSQMIAAGHHLQNKPSTYTQTSRSQRILVHPMYQKEGKFTNDIALVKLVDPIKFNDGVRPICLPQQGASIPTQQTCVVAGWGRNVSGFDTRTPEALQQSVDSVQSASVCSRAYGNTYQEKSMICAGTTPGGTCRGDSGGALVCRQGDSWVQEGVVSYGSQSCKQINAPGVFARVGTYVDWIKEGIQLMSSVK
jgi:hypothetical protein